MPRGKREKSVSGVSRVFRVKEGVPYVACMVCGAIMLVHTDNIPSGIANHIPVDECADVLVKIKIPFSPNIMQTYAHQGFVSECPFCVFQHDEHIRNMLSALGVVIM